jgi:hypothetical protein
VKQLFDRDEDCLAAANSWRNQKHPALNSRSSPFIQPLGVPEYIELLNFLFIRWERVRLVVDAVDECVDLATFVDGLQSLAKNSELQLFLTSRHDVELNQAISPISTAKIAVSEHMDTDIIIYLRSEVQARIAHNFLKLRQKDLSLQIVEALRKNADGM